MSFNSYIVAVSGLTLFFWVWSGRSVVLPAACLADVGWSPAKLRTVGYLFAATIGVAVVGGVRVMADATTSTMIVVAAVIVWLIPLSTIAMRGLVLNVPPAARQDACMNWLHEMRLLAVSGVPVNAACLQAAEKVDAQAFRLIRSSITEAVATGHDPLRFTADRFKTEPIAGILLTIANAETQGAATSGLLDEVLGRAVKSLETVRRANIERLARRVLEQSTMITLSAGLLIVAAVMFTLDLSIF